MPRSRAPRDLGWADGRLRFEIFATAAPLAGDQPFEVVLNSSGKTFLIPPDKTILAGADRGRRGSHA